MFLALRKIAYLNQRAILKPVFPHQIFTCEATFFFCLSLIISTWFQPKAQGQKKKSLRAKIFASEKPAKDGYFY